jgi:hypothetical protein
MKKISVRRFARLIQEGHPLFFLDPQLKKAATTYLAGSFRKKLWLGGMVSSLILIGVMGSYLYWSETENLRMWVTLAAAITGCAVVAKLSYTQAVKATKYREANWQLERRKKEYEEAAEMLGIPDIFSRTLQDVRRVAQAKIDKLFEPWHRNQLLTSTEQLPVLHDKYHFLYKLGFLEDDLQTYQANRRQELKRQPRGVYETGILGDAGRTGQEPSQERNRVYSEPPTRARTH